jgi:MFS family permease
MTGSMTGATRGEPAAGPGAPRPRLVTPGFLLVVASTLAYFVSVGMLLPTVPRFIEGPLGGSDVAVGASIGVFSLSAVLLRPLAGRFADRRGRRPLMVGGAAVVAASVAAYHLVGSVPSLVVARLVAGCGEAMFFVGAASAVTDLAPEERRGEATSLFSLALYGGISIGPLVGEALLGRHGFSAVWWPAAAFGLVAALLGLRVVDARPEGAGTRATARVVHPAAVLPGLVLASTVWGFAAFSAFVSLYALRLGMAGSRFAFFTYAVTVLLIRLVGARIPDLLGARRAATVATATVAAGMTVIAAWGTPAGLLAGSFVFGVGQAFAFPALLTLAVRRAPASERGAVVGTYSAFVDLAFGVGAIALGPVAHAVGYRGTFAASAAVAVAGLVLLRARVRDALAPGPAAEAAVSPAGP